MSANLGHFELLEEIGKGSMATVFKAYDPSLNRMVAIRLLDENLAQQDPQFVESFIHEAQTAASINHPNIVPIYFVGEENGNYYIAMELLEGRSLDQIIMEEGPQSEEAVLKIGIQIAGALGAAYANQMVHGDIKPQNIFITSRGVAKLLDFGLAKMANIESAPGGGGNVWGSAYYISPERVGQKAEDFRSDIYSLGATLFHALVGHPPFEADTPEELALKRLSEKAPGLRTMNPAISAKTAQIVARMLNKSAFLRYLDYDKLIEDLRASAAPAAGKQPAGSANIPRRQPASPIIIDPKAAAVVAPRKPNLLPLVITCIVAGLVLCAGIIFLLLQSNKVDSTRAAANDVTAPQNTPAPITTYTLTTTDGNGGGKYAAGTVVTVTANAPGSGYQFSGWSGDKGTLANASETTTTLTMPAADMAIAATYSPIPVPPTPVATGAPAVSAAETPKPSALPVPAVTGGRPGTVVSVQFNSDEIESGGLKAGVVPASHWNSDLISTSYFANETNGINNLVDSTGAATGINESRTDYGHYGPNGPTTGFSSPGDNSLFSHGFFGAFKGNNFSLTLTNLNASATYNLILYVRGAQPGQITLNNTSTESSSGKTYRFNSTDSSATGFIRATSTSDDSYPTANYIEWDGLTGVTNLNAIISGADGIDFDGFQLVVKSGPGGSVSTSKSKSESGATVAK